MSLHTCVLTQSRLPAWPHSDVNTHMFLAHVDVYSTHFCIRLHASLTRVFLTAHVATAAHARNTHTCLAHTRPPTCVSLNAHVAKAAAARQIAAEKPEFMMGARVTVRSSNKIKMSKKALRKKMSAFSGSYNDGVIIAYAAGINKHIAQSCDDSVFVVHWNSDESIVSLMPPALSHGVTVAPRSRYFRECIVCFKLCAAKDLAEFCFARCERAFCFVLAFVFVL
jgi:hypothetical protein